MLSRISIIIPTYNSEKSIYRALDSIINQTFLDYEIIIIDNLSTDYTLKIIKSYIDDRIKIVSEKDNGIYDAMNKGIELSSGEWLYFLGSDDELFDQDVFSDFYEQTINSNKKIFYGNVVLSGDTAWGMNGQIYDGAFTLEKLLKTNIAHQAMFYNKMVFAKGNSYNITYKICADYDFNLRAWIKYQPQYFERIIAKFNTGGASTSVRDWNFEWNFSTNIVTYFNKLLYKSEFQRFEIAILQQAKENLKKGKILQATYLGTLGMYFKLKRKFVK